MRAAALLLALVGATYGLVSAYHVDPVTALWSGKARPDLGVSQLVTCNFDYLDSMSGGYVELFVGDNAGAGSYDVNVYEYPGGIDRIAYSENRQPQFGHTWLRFPMATSPGQSFTKGKQYEFRFTRSGSGSDSIEFYYDHTDPYKFGSIPNDIAPNPADLCMRVYGISNVIARSDFGATVFLPDSAYYRTDWDNSMAEVGLGWGLFDCLWHVAQPEPNVWDFSAADTYLAHTLNAGAEPVALIWGTPHWASTCMETVKFWLSDPNHPGESTLVVRADTSVHSPPSGLWADGITSVNHWALYVDSLVTHFDRTTEHGVHSYLIWNEPNDTTTEYNPCATGWWRRPMWYYGPLGEGPRPLCSLYVRLAFVAESVIHDKAGHDTDRVVVGNMHRVFNPSGVSIVSGRDWLEMMCQIAARYPDSVFWNVVSAHFYQLYHVAGTQYNWRDSYDPEQMDVEAETLRAVMRRNRDYGELWNTETGWTIPDASNGNGPSEDRAAMNVSEMFTNSFGSAVKPAGGIDRTCFWYSFEQFNYYGLLHRTGDDSTSLWRREAFYAFKQTQEQLVGKRLSGRVLLGDERDDSCRIYEFENPADNGKKSWVAWRDALETDEQPEPTVEVSVPVRSDELGLVELDYAGNPPPPSGPQQAKANGWLDLSLTTRPMFFRESTAVSRPDLVVDSLHVQPANPQVGKPMGLGLYLHNNASDTTPDSVTVQFLCNDSVFGETRIDSIAGNATATAVLIGYNVPAWMHGNALFSVRVNPGQAFVEMGMDDNSGYQKKVVRRPPDGDIEIASQDGYTNVPLVPVSLHSADYERDSTGNTPCASARFLVYSYDKNDTVVAAETTAWFSGNVTDTVVPRGLAALCTGHCMTCVALPIRAMRT